MKLGFIGCGNMAGAMLGGILKAGLLKKEDIIASALHEESRERIGKEFGIAVTGNNREVVERSKVVVLAVKPQFYEEVITEVKDAVTEAQVIVTIAPGKTVAWLTGVFAKPVKIVRTMPNTPALVGEGMTGVCKNELVSEAELLEVNKLLGAFGKVEEVPEYLMEAVVSVSGSSPAYVFMFIEAMADAAVREGIPRKKAYKFAAQAVLGSAKMVLETGIHPGELKDMVCSPAGTTIEAVRVLEEKGLRSAVMEAMKECTKAAKSF